MTFLLDPFGHEFMLRALIGGLLVGALTSVVGTWVVLRGMAFLGEAMAHGMLPGVAASVLLGLPGQLGALVTAGAMAVGVGVLSKRGRIAQDTIIGILFVGMLSLGVLIVSAARSTPINLTAILFGDILAIRWADVVLLLATASVVVAVFLVFHRSFTALVFDQRIAHTLQLRPRVALFVLMGGVAVAIVSSYQAVGTLLVVGMLLAPAATGVLWARSTLGVTVIGWAVSALSVVLGLFASWYADLAAGPAIAMVAVVVFGGSYALRKLVDRGA